jgi:hypothetical protein
VRALPLANDRRELEPDQPSTALALEAARRHGAAWVAGVDDVAARGAAPRMLVRRQPERLRAFVAAVDLVAPRAVEVKVRSPGGFVDASDFGGVGFTGAALDAVERALASR